MLFSKSRRFIFIFVAAGFVSLACDLSTFLPGSVARPTVVIQSPANDASFKVGDEISIQSTSLDPSGVVRVELLVDGQVVATDMPPIPQGQASFSLVQKWKATAGAHTISVRAYNAAGTGSDPAMVSVNVASGPVALASPTTSVGSSPAAPTATSAPQPTDTSTSAAQPTATRRPATATRPPASPTSAAPAAPPGLYAVSLRLEPPNPKINQFVTFYVAFLNTTGETKRYRWFVKIFRPDERNSFGETAKKDDDFPVGRVELVSPSNWRVGGFADCQPFFARVFWYDLDTTLVTEFLKTDGQSVNTGFSVCP